MIRDQSPGITLGLRFFEDSGQAVQEGLAIFVVEEKLTTFYSPRHHVLEKAGGVKSGLAGHKLRLTSDLFW